MKILKSIVIPIIGSITLIGCGASKNISNISKNAINYSVNLPAKKIKLTKKQSNSWLHTDLKTDTIPGMSTLKAYDFLANKNYTTVIVGVIDSGINLKHEDLIDVAWINEDEISENGIDDDNNGYIDDMNGWNFLGIVYKEHSEYQRILKNPEITTLTEYTAAKKMLKDKISKAKTDKQFYEKIIQTLTDADIAFAKHFEKTDYTPKDVINLKTDDIALQKYQNIAKKMYAFGMKSLVESKKLFTKEINNANNILNKYFLKTDYRTVLNDNPNDIKDTHYGNNNTENSILGESHGTHVSGIIAASINNGKGINGIATHVKIMALRAVPDGDEYDKDIALAIRYAVDNGAKVINTSFGKGFSPQKKWVWKAIKYAAKHDVLIVNAAGNSGKNIDIEKTFPIDSKNLLTEISDNFITIGAISSNYNKNLLAPFSNYGKINVDIFAPGVDIYSTMPENNYKKMSGTSMAAPAVTGVAALIRSYYPNLSAPQVKHILMESGTIINFEVIKPGTRNKKIAFSELSVSGKIINAYHAILLADKITNNN